MHFNYYRVNKSRPSRLREGKAGHRKPYHAFDISHRVGTPFTQPGNNAAHRFQGFGTPLGRQKARRIEPFDAPQEALHGIAHFVQLDPRGGSKVGSSQPCHRGTGAEVEIRDQGIASAAVVGRNPKGLEHQPENRGDQDRVVFPCNFFAQGSIFQSCCSEKSAGKDTESTIEVLDDL